MDKKNEKKTNDIKVSLNNINNNDKKEIKIYELYKSFLLHTDKNTPLTNIISDNICKIKVVNILSKNKIKGIININYNFLKFNFIILNKNFSTKEELYYFITQTNDIESMLVNFNNYNYFINVMICELNKNNYLLCNII